MRINKRNSYRHCGFSLVEISIVLLIIGTLVGLISGSTKLLQNAEDKKVMVDYNKVESATLGFLDAYGQIPGDFSQASLYWATTCTDYVDGADTYDCNGNGDGRIATLDLAGNSNDLEALRFWQHLGLSGYIEVQLSGIPSSGATDMSAGENVFRGVLKGSNLNITTNFFGVVNSGLTVYLSRRSSIETPALPADLLAWGGVSPTRILQFDTKFDDGLPRSGKIWASEVSPQACVNLAGTAYEVNTESEYCIMGFKIF